MARVAHGAAVVCVLAALLVSQAAGSADQARRLGTPHGLHDLLPRSPRRGFLDGLVAGALRDASGSAGGRRGLIGVNATLYSSSNGGSAANDFLASSLFMTPEVVQNVVGGTLLTSASCDIDSTCVSGWDANQHAVVQLTHPILGNFCTGTLISGNNGTVYVLTARHCVLGEDASFVYPWSTYGVLFNYRLPCNESKVSASDLSMFSQYLQGLRVAFVDKASDVALLELLDDIPPAYNATLAGWDVRDTPLPFNFVDISQPAGDVEKYTAGVVEEAYKGEVFYSDGSVQDDTSYCSGFSCGFYMAFPTKGAMEPGSSGSGLILESTKRVVGVLSAGGGDTCDDDPNSPNQAEQQFGRLAMAWSNGLWTLISNSNNRTYTDTVAYSAPLPGVIVDNDVPNLFSGSPSTYFAVRLTSAPPSGTDTTTLTLASSSSLVQLNTSSLTFTSSNWSQPQSVEVSQGSGTPPSNLTTYNLTLTWPAVTSASANVNRTRIMTGILSPSTPGTSLVNPYNITKLPYPVTVKVPSSTDSYFVRYQEGPFVPTQYMQYTTGSQATGVLVWVCPGLTGSTDGPWAVFLDEQLSSNLAVPSAGPWGDSKNRSCSGFLALLNPNYTYNIFTAPTFSNTGPGASGFVKEYFVNVTAVTVADTLDHMSSAGSLTTIDSVPATLTGNVTYGQPAVPFLLIPPKTSTYDISTCNGGTTVDTGLAIYNADANLQLVASDDGANSTCSQLLDLKLTANTNYLLVVGQAQKSVLSQDAVDTVDLSVAFHGAAANTYAGSGSNGFGGRRLRAGLRR